MTITAYEGDIGYLPNGPDWPLLPPRLTRFRYDLLGPKIDDNGNLIREAYLGMLEGVKSGGNVTWKSTSAIKGGGTINVADTGQEIDWLNVRIRPMVRIESPDGTRVIETACGVFVPAAPVGEWTDTGRTWSVELLDKLSILDQDIPSDDNGNPYTMGLPAGTNVLDAVRAMITSSGESAERVPTGTEVLRTSATWDMGTTKLQIINNLLSAIDYFSLSADPQGYFRTGPYIPAEERPPIYDLTKPFMVEGGSLVNPNWSVDHDIYAIPNRMIAVSSSDESTPAMVAVVTDEDPNSPFSYTNRGRWITVVDTGVDSASQASLLGYTRRRMTMLRNQAVDVQISHLYLPDLLIDTVVEFQAGTIHGMFTVHETMIQFDSNALAYSLLRLVGT